MRVIELKNVVRRYASTTILEKLSLTINAGQALCLFGPSGCGKTTLLRLLARIDRPQEGAIFTDGHCVNHPDNVVAPVPGQIGMVFQDRALWPHLRVRAHLDFVLGGRGVSRHERRTRIDAMLTTCRIRALDRAYPAELSGGEQQRLAIARALITTPSLLLLDEPLANLDADLRSVMLDEFNRCKQAGATLVFATHDPAEAEALGDIMLRMEAGHFRVESVIHDPNQDSNKGI